MSLSRRETFSRRRQSNKGTAEVSCSSTHAVAVTAEGRALTWALTGAKHANKFGQLCRGSKLEGDLSTPGAVPTGRKVIAAAAGGTKDSGHTALVLDDGTLWTCGSDRWQQLGLSGGSAAAANAVGYTWSKGRLAQATPQRVPSLSGIDRVALGGDHSLAASKDRVFAWGKGSEGQLGAGTSPFLAAPGRSPALEPMPGESLAGLFAMEDCSAAAFAKPPGTDHPTRLAFVGKCTELHRRLGHAHFFGEALNEPAALKP